jgi:hypothetical protein
MKYKSWRKQHKWFGLILALFLVSFSVSGLVLNHASLFAHLDIGRDMLPQHYRYHRWNNGLVRGSMVWNDHVLLYGNNGIYLTDSTARQFADFNEGLPTGADLRNMRGLAVTRDHHLFAAATRQLYRLSYHGQWKAVALRTDEGEMLSDITIHGDSLIVTGRSHVYLSLPPYRRFAKITLLPPSGHDGRVSLFRTVWLLHSGALFGIIGRLIVDAMAFLFIFLSLSGIVTLVMDLTGNSHKVRMRQRLLRWHNHVGKASVGLALFVTVTGWLLRPPGLAAIAYGRVPAMPLSIMDTDNAWTEELRTLRYDEGMGDWLLSSSKGFYSLNNLHAVPRSIPRQPYVSVMGVNVQETDHQGTWLIGSFSGLEIWNRHRGTCIDAFTHKPAVRQRIPVSDHLVTGYVSGLIQGDGVIDYNEGGDFAVMPQWMEGLPMSLRALCLEIHTGRIYPVIGSTIFYIFIIGLAIVWCLYSGWKLRKRW